MNLGFSEELNGKRTRFINKIWSSELFNYSPDYNKFAKEYMRKFGQYWDGYGNKEEYSKKHTFRHDLPNRWKKGNKIHFHIGRGKSRFAFAPVGKALSTQYCQIKVAKVKGFSSVYLFNVVIDSRELTLKEIEEFAFNDGFDSIEDFGNYFQGHHVGKIIHWTYLKY